VRLGEPREDREEDAPDADKEDEDHDEDAPCRDPRVGPEEGPVAAVGAREPVRLEDLSAQEPARVEQQIKRGVSS
jgi:hypothetical protein